MINQARSGRSLRQMLHWGAHQAERCSPADTMFTNTGRRIYVIGDIDGRFRPRSNPYDLYSFGRPNPQDPLAEKLQGVWAQPVKGINQYGYIVEVNGAAWALDDADRFLQAFAYVEFEFNHPGEAHSSALQAVRRDYASQDLPLLFSTLTLRNNSSQPLDLRVRFQCEFDLQDAWFTHLAERRNAGETVSIEGDRLLARSEVLANRWAAAAGGTRLPEAVRLIDPRSGELVYHFQLDPHFTETLTFAMTVESKGGAQAALDTLRHGLDQSAETFAQNQAFFEQVFARGPHFHSPDSLLNAAFDLARANLHLLEAEQPQNGRYFYAGLEMFPFWFSNDGAYSVVGMLSSGLCDSALNHIRLGLRHLEDGRVPHQLSPAGHIAFSGNAQETPLWVMSIWDAYRWTGDRDFLAEMYPGALHGLFDYVLGKIDRDGDGYPSGPGMVEVEGMGAEKLDSAAYTWAALNALAAMAQVLGDSANAQEARSRALRIAARFDADWWDPDSQTYAMSLTEPDNARYPVPHWAIIVPLEVGLSTPEHAAQTFATLRAQYLNRWGIKHTAGEDERVWTLPTATLSRAAYRFCEPELGFEMLRHIAETLESGSIGLFHELIPEGACFIQLWSGATFLRGVIEDLLGLEVNAAEHRLRIAPQLPPDWENTALTDLVFGGHRLNVNFTKDVIQVEHISGPQPLTMECTDSTGAAAPLVVPPNQTARIARG